MKLGQTGETIKDWPHYEVAEIKSIKDIRSTFPSGVADNLNWLFIGTGGLHGSKMSLNEIESILRGTHPDTQPFKDKYYVTVMVVQPRLCNLRFGEILIGLEDLYYLRRLVRTTLAEIEKSQEGSK